jgi:hypothetical protein
LISCADAKQSYRIRKDLQDSRIYLGAIILHIVTNPCAHTPCRLMEKGGMRGAEAVAMICSVMGPNSSAG